jgi:arylsulfatase A-like enzyme
MHHPGITSRRTGRALTFGAVLTLALAVADEPSAQAGLGYKPNILFIAVDDLNTWITHLGAHPNAKTPNIDRLARMGTSFTRAYTAAPICNPSRAALLGGRRPWVTGVYGNEDDWYAAVKDLDTLPELFMKNGYHVMATGKLFHETWPHTSSEFWNEYKGFAIGLHPPTKPYQGVSNALDWGPIDVNPDVTGDRKAAFWAGERLNRTYTKPFFLALGFRKPHLEWYMPRKYFDMHPLSRILLPKIKEDDLDDLPAAALRFINRRDHPAILEQNKWKKAVQAYLASISYIDDQVGVVLNALENSPHRNKTIVVFWGDHGWHLGQKRHWRKNTLWEEATRVPLIWVVPGLTIPDTRSGRTVDLMSIYPTLSELAGIPRPAHVQGPSIISLLRYPRASWTQPAVSTRGAGNHAVRSKKWRYIRYNDGSEELYDHDTDPREWNNLAGNPNYNHVKQQLQQYLP